MPTCNSCPPIKKYIPFGCRNFNPVCLTLGMLIGEALMFESNYVIMSCLSCLMNSSSYVTRKNATIERQMYRIYIKIRQIFFNCRKWYCSIARYSSDATCYNVCYYSPASIAILTIEICWFSLTWKCLSAWLWRFWAINTMWMAYWFLPNLPMLLVN